MALSQKRKALNDTTPLPHTTKRHKQSNAAVSMVPSGSTDGSTIKSEKSPTGGKSTKHECEEKDCLPYLNYLSTFNSSRSGSITSDVPTWKFSKSKQSWLLKHLFSEGMIPDGDYWGMMLLYLEGLKGNSKQWVLARAKDLAEADLSSSESEAKSDEDLSDSGASSEVESVTDKKFDAVEPQENMEKKIDNRIKNRALKKWRIARGMDVLRVLS
ncbi:hypothetical protein BKA69DRAFT_1081192 [Paraphysoderma sedebokerense]|nr:hypothetical protein BKA69DRAFT_1081192 [Paraphysoderma sedebokerense]